MIFGVEMSLLYALTDLVWSQAIGTTSVFLVCLPMILILKTRHPTLAMCLCWLILLRLILPTDLTFPTSIQTIFEFVFPSTNPDNSAYHTAFDTDLSLYTVDPAIEDSGKKGFFLVSAFIFYIVCALFMFIRFSTQRRKLKHCISRGKTIYNVDVLRKIAVWKALLKIRRPVQLSVSETSRFIFTIGTLKPTVSIPQHLLDTLTPQDLEVAIAHELAHIKRHDDLLILITLIFRSVFFFFPVVWITCELLSNCREKACDQEVLSRKRIPTTNYALSLVNIVAASSNQTAYTSAAQFGSKNASLMRERIFYLNKENVMKKTQRSPTTALLILMTVFLLPGAPAVVGASYNTNSLYASPVKNGWISSVYGPRNWPIGPEKGKRKVHKGIDIAGAEGTKIFTVGKGTVVELVEDHTNSDQPARGKYLVVDHGNGVQSRYMHLKEINVLLGQKLKENTVIALMGATGQASGPHLHFELWVDNKHTNPADHIVFSLPTVKPKNY